MSSGDLEGQRRGGGGGGGGGGARDEVWATSFAALPPKTTLSTLRSRLTKASQFNDHLAELFDKRSAIEMEYVEKLAKLGRKVEASGVVPVGTGAGGSGEVKAWDMVLKELNGTCSLHTSFAHSLSSDLVPPIRDMTNKLPLWSRVGVMDSNVDKVVKAWDTARNKVDKAQKKGGPKLTAAQSELNNLTSDLEIQTPTLYTAYQQLEAARLARLKETLVKWETVRSDLGHGILEGSERGMNVLLGWEVDRDVETVASKISGGAPAGQPAGSLTPGSRRQTSDYGRPASSYEASPQRNGPSQDNGSVSNLPQNTSLSSTLMSKFGRKNSIMSGHGHSGGFFGGHRDRSGSVATVGRTGSASGTGAGAVETIADSAESSAGYETQRRQGDLRQPSADTSGVAGPGVDSEGFSVPPANRDQAPWDRDGAPRNLIDDDNDESDNVSALPMAATPTTGNTVSGKYSLAMAPLPIEESEADRQAALQKVQSTLLAAPPSGSDRGVSRRSTQRGRRDVRNTTFQAVPDDMPLAQALKLKGISEGANGMQQVEASGGLVESPTTGVFGGQPALTAQPTGASSISTHNPFGPGSAMNRQASGVSTASSATSNNPFDGHPKATLGSGLRASITETVNVMSRGGTVSRAMITGEITLSLRDLERITANGIHAGPIHIRLDQFEQLDKVAPNPKYLAQVPDRPGEYFLNAEVLAHVTSTGGHQPTLFKYQLHVGEGRAQGFAPIEVNAQWKPMEGETRLLLAYRAPPDSRLSQQASSLGGDAKFTDLTIVAGLGGAAVTNVQAKPPGGTWIPETRRMTWKADDLPIGGAGKIAARFLTEAGSIGQPENVTVKWRADGLLTSGLGISIVSSGSEATAATGPGSSWHFEEVRKAVVSGKYIAEPA